MSKVQFTIQIANRVVAISAMFNSTHKYCESFLSKKEPDFCIDISMQDIEYERIIADRECKIEGLPAKNIDITLFEHTALQRKIAEKLFEFDTLLFHGSVVAVNGYSYLFTAKSGTGKSTHTRLWREMFGDCATMVNDDKPFLRITQNTVYACGSPWNGKHRLGNNICVPLKAICILERGEHNEIARISAQDAVPMLLQQSNRPQQPALLPKYLELLEHLTDKIAFYRLKCNMDPEAARIAYQTMSGCAKE